MFSLSSTLADEGQRTLEDEDALRPDRAAQANEIGARIDTALSEINSEQAEVFELRERRGMDYADIAHKMGVAEGTVKSRLHRARLAFSRIFQLLAKRRGGLT